MKSEVAAKVIKTVNSNINIQNFVENVEPTTEEIYNDQFFEQLNGVIDASDNRGTRKYFIHFLL